MDDEIALANRGSARATGYGTGDLPRVTSRHSQRIIESRGQEHSLPPADGGVGAWLFLAGGFFVEALIWGFPFSYGVFQEYYSTHAPFSPEPSGIAAIGSSAMGIMYLGSPFIFAVLQKWPTFRRWCAVEGLFTIVFGLILSSFANKVWHLITTQGVIYAVGGCMLYTPTILFMDEWFVRRKGFAFGVMWAGTGVSGVCIPFVMTWGLNRYNFSTMLRVWSITLFVLAGPLLYFIRPRIPLSMNPPPQNFNFRFLRTSTFWMLQAGNILESLGFFIPGIYLPTYAHTLGYSAIAGTIVLSLLNTFSVFGSILCGSLTDLTHVTNVILISSIGATISVFLFWGLAASFPFLCIFSIVYGLFAGGFSATWPGIIREVRKQEDSAVPGMIFGMLSAGRGIGSVVSGPISEAILGEQPWVGEAALGYGTGFGGLIALTGVSAALGGVSWIARRIGWI